MIQRYLILSIAICLFSCEKKSTEANLPIDFTKDKSQISALMSEQEASWNRADIDGFMKHYWNSDSLCFIGKRGLSYGWKTTRDNYVKSYPDAAAMGTLQFTNSVIDVMDTTHTYVIGKWELFRVSDTLSGHYSLLWKKISGKWVIVADHSS